MIDPWAGSYAMESLTEQMYEEGVKIIRQVEDMGGMAEAVGSGEWGGGVFLVNCWLSIYFGSIIGNQ